MADTNVLATTDRLHLKASDRYTFAKFGVGQYNSPRVLFQANIQHGAHVLADTDALTLTTFIALIDASGPPVEIFATTDTLTLQEFDATIAHDINVPALTDALVVQGFDATFIFNVNVPGLTDALTLTENIAGVAHDIVVTGTTDPLVLDFQNGARWDLQARYNTTQYTYNDAGNLATIDLIPGANIFADTDSLELFTGARYGKLARYNTARYVYDDEQFRAFIGFDRSLVAITDTLTLTEFAANVALDIDISATTDTLTLAQFDATVTIGAHIIATTDTLVLTSHLAFIGPVSSNRRRVMIIE